jgi:hypothetical protein
MPQKPTRQNLRHQKTIKRRFSPVRIWGDPSVNTTTDPSGKKPSCPVAPQPDPEVVITDNAILVLTHLNQVSGSGTRNQKPLWKTSVLVCVKVIPSAT